MDADSLSKERLLKRIIGEIVLSEKPGETIKKWRNIFQVSQRELAKEMRIIPSVISDYESGRRKNPGIKMIKKVGKHLIDIDLRRGGKIIKNFSQSFSDNIVSDSILDIKELTVPLTVKKFTEKLKSELMVGEGFKKNEVYGYTVIDSLKAILDLPPMDLVKIYGLTTQRVLIFTGVSSGRSPMVALKVTNLKPGLVIFHGLDRLDELAKRIAEVEKIPIAICRTDLKDMLNSLKKLS